MCIMQMKQEAAAGFEENQDVASAVIAIVIKGREYGALEYCIA